MTEIIWTSTIENSILGILLNEKKNGDSSVHRKIVIRKAREWMKKHGVVDRPPSIWDAVNSQYGHSMFWADIGIWTWKPSRTERSAEFLWERSFREDNVRKSWQIRKCRMNSVDFVRSLSILCGVCQDIQTMEIGSLRVWKIDESAPDWRRHIALFLNRHEQEIERWFLGKS
jgi:hypothetical protein